MYIAGLIASVPILFAAAELKYDFLVNGSGKVSGKYIFPVKCTLIFRRSGINSFREISGGYVFTYWN